MIFHPIDLYLDANRSNDILRIPTLFHFSQSPHTCALPHVIVGQVTSREKQHYLRSVGHVRITHAIEITPDLFFYLFVIKSFKLTAASDDIPKIYPTVLIRLIQIDYLVCV